MNQNKNKETGGIKGASFLLVLIFILLFLYFNAGATYKQDVTRWTQILGTYLISFALILTLGLVVAPKVVKALAGANYWKSFGLRFIPSLLLTATILIFFKAIFKGTDSVNPITAIGYLTPIVLIFHIFVVAQIEEIMFRGVLFESLLHRGSKLSSAYFITAITFGLFHYASSGGSFLVMGTYIPLSYAWTYIKLNGYPILNKIPRLNNLFSATRLTQQSNAGSHAGWNLFIIGFQSLRL